MIKAFIDSSVLFAAAYSSTGNAHDLVQLGIENKIALIISDDVVVEVRRNFEKKYPDRLAVVEFFFEKAAFEEAVSPTPEEVPQLLLPQSPMTANTFWSHDRCKKSPA